MDSRKNQLQKQIIEAFKANDKDLYYLLKSQLAHRYGVESLEEFNNLDLSQLNQNLNNENNQNIDQSKDYILEDAKAISIKDDDNQEKEITKKNKRLIDSSEVEIKESYEKNDKKQIENNVINPVIEYKRAPKVSALIPLPPKPKYSYLNKWLLRSSV